MISRPMALYVCGMGVLGLLAQDTAWAGRASRSPDYTALAMADQIASDRLRALEQGQSMPVVPTVLAALPDNLDDLPFTAAGKMSSSMVMKPSAVQAAPVVVPTLVQDKPRESAEARFDLSISNAPAKQVFMQLGTGTPYSVLVAPEVSGVVSLQLKNTTVIEALEALRDLYGYDFRVTGKRVMIYPNMCRPACSKSTTCLAVAKGCLTCVSAVTRCLRLAALVATRRANPTRAVRGKRAATTRPRFAPPLTRTSGKKSRIHSHP
jgi:hypothetical protein